MTVRLCQWSLIGLTLMLCACDQRSPDTSLAARSEGVNSIAQDIARTESTVRLSMAEKRIALLEKKLAEMEITPQTVEIDLLKSRLEAVEAKVYARQDEAMMPTDGAKPTTTPTSRAGPARPAPTTKQDATRTPLRLPQLEPATRAATDAEKAAFSARPN